MGFHYLYSAGSIFRTIVDYPCRHLVLWTIREDTRHDYRFIDLYGLVFKRNRTVPVRSNGEIQIRLAIRICIARVTGGRRAVDTKNREFQVAAILVCHAGKRLAAGTTRIFGGRPQVHTDKHDQECSNDRADNKECLYGTDLRCHNLDSGRLKHSVELKKNFTYRKNPEVR
jgi:hypothetical protein